MANIKVNDLQPTGSELFFDSESFLNELSDAEMDIKGGWSSISIGACGNNSTASFVFCGY